jgi:hypothetical protein
MQGERPKFMDPAKAAEVVVAKVDPGKPLTVADAAAATGLALRDAERALQWLSKEYRGQLRVTSEGQLVHLFPTGFRKPWETRDAISRAAGAVGHAALGVLRFVVRAWVSIVLVAYAAIFVALLIGLTMARQGNDSRRSGGLPGGALFYLFFRVLADALFWTFHPWSPFAYGHGAYGTGYDAWGQPAFGRAQASRRKREEPKIPLYERVNRFFFGPTPPREDPLERERLVVQAIRAGKGRIGLADVMRVTGLPREQADPLMAKLMLDFDGDVGVSEEGGIYYSFPELRKTAADAAPEAPPPPAWKRAPPLPPLTGNGVGANLAIGALNTFNMLMGAYVIANGLTIERIVHLFDKVPQPFVDTGVPIALGVVPLVFSAMLFLLPIGRALVRPWRTRAAARERGRLAATREVLERVKAKQPVTDAAVTEAWKQAAGTPPDPKQVDRELVRLGGDVAIEDSGETRWRFADLETEAAAVEAERDAAAEDEAKLGPVVFASDR